MWLIVERYRQCKTFRALPRNGGIAQQSRLEMRLLTALALAEERVEQERRLKERDAAMRAIGPMALMFFPPK